MGSFNPLAFAADNSASLNINGHAYSWKDLDVKMLGSSVFFLESINFDESEEASFSVGLGQSGKALGIGNRVVTGSMEIAISEFFKLCVAAGVVSPMGSILDIPVFNISITYYSNLSNIRATNILNVKLTKVGQAHKQGDQHFISSVDFIASHIQNVGI